MKGTPIQYDQIQRWMQAVITHPGGIGAGVSSEAARQTIDVGFEELETIVTRSESLTGAERLAIYSRGYHARLIECFRAEFPCLLHALGDDLFNQFVIEYLLHYPPRSYTLNRLAESFPRFLAESRPDAEAPRDERESWPDFIIDLATFERAFFETFNGPGVEDRVQDSDKAQPRLSSNQVLNIPDERFSEMGVEPSPCLRLLAFHYPVGDYFLAARRQQNPDLPAPAETFIAMTRQNYVVRFFNLTAMQYELLRALMDSLSISQALSLAAEMSGQDIASVSTKARGWLREWVDASLLVSLVSERTEPQ